MLPGCPRTAGQEFDASVSRYDSSWRRHSRFMPFLYTIWPSMFFLIAFMSISACFWRSSGLRSTALSSPPLICFLSSLFSLRSFWISACRSYHHWRYSDGHLTGDQLPHHDVPLLPYRLPCLGENSAESYLLGLDHALELLHIVEFFPIVPRPLVGCLGKQGSDAHLEYSLLPNCSQLGKSAKPRIVFCKGRQAPSCPRSELQLSSFHALGICPESAHKLLLKSHCWQALRRKRVQPGHAHC